MTREDFEPQFELVCDKQRTHQADMGDQIPGRRNFMRQKPRRRQWMDGWMESTAA
jgi:hypothetical protein